jgi:hypothetical protein
MVTEDLFPDLATAMDSINPGNEKPKVIIPTNGLRDQAVALVKGFALHNKSIYLLGKASPILVRAQHNGKDTAFFETLDIDRLRNEIEKTVTVVKNTKNKKETYLAKLKPELMKAILALDLESLPFDYIEGVVDHSIIAPDGNIVDTYGYNKESQLFINCTVPFEKMDNAEAKGIIMDIINDFPFANNASIANTLAMLFTFVCKPLYNGLTPMFLIKAPKEGTGKTLLARAVIASIIGSSPCTSTVTDNNEEMSKVLTTIVKNGSEYLILDNMPDNIRFDVPSLVSAVTSGIYQGRLLCTNTEIKAPFNTVVILTGNNPVTTAELSRRVVPIELNCKQNDIQYKHPDLIQYCIENRSYILNAVLSLGKDWYDTGHKADKTKKLDGFEQWTNTVSGIIQYIGTDNFLQNQEKLYEETVQDTYATEAEFLQAVYNHNPDCYSYTAKELIPFAIENGIIDTGKNEKVNAVILGKALLKIKDRTIGGFVVKRSGRSEWRIVLAKN